MWLSKFISELEFEMMSKSDAGTNSKIKAVVFDLGNVLIEADESKAVSSWAAAAGLPAEQVERIYHADTHYKAMECGQIDIAQYHKLLSNDAGLEISFDEFLAGWNSIIGPVLPGVADMVTELENTVRLVCLTNTSEVHADIWRPGCGELFNNFGRVFCSYEMGIRKPDPASFVAVLDWLGLPAGAIAFVDDRAENVLAANKLGLAGVCAFGAAEAVAGLRSLGVAV